MDIINVYGVKKNIGSSHLAILLTGFLEKMEYDAAYCGENKSKAAEFGVSILDVPKDEITGNEPYDYLVIDRGTDYAANGPSGISVIVTGNKPNEKAAESAIRQLSAAKDAIFVNNFTSDADSVNLCMPWHDKRTVPDASNFPDFYALLMTEYLRRKADESEGSEEF